MMKILRPFLIITLCTMSSVYAGQNLPIETVKQMYQESRELEDTNILAKYADKHLGQTLKRMEKVFTDSGMVCGYDYDVLWHSQDPEYHRKLTFTQLPNQQVKVDLAKTELTKAETLIYQLNCQSNRCKVSDVLENGRSLKQKILRSCR